MAITVTMGAALQRLPDRRSSQSDDLVSHQPTHRSPLQGPGQTPMVRDAHSKNKQHAVMANVYQVIKVPSMANETLHKPTYASIVC